MMKMGHDVIVWDDIKKDLPFTYVAPQDIDPKSIDKVIFSPGIPFEYPTLHPVVARARKSHIPIVTDLDILQEVRPHDFYIGITGTNGKSTTTALVSHIFSNNQTAVRMAGNIGIPCLGFDHYDHPHCYVLEISSFQLDISRHLRFSIAALMNVTPDHIDRHGSLNQYFAAKRHIFNHATTRIISIDDNLVYDWWRQQGSSHEWITICHKGNQRNLQPHYTYDEAFIFDGQGQPIINLADVLYLKGIHNAQNIAFAYAIAKAYGVPHDDVVSNIKTYKGLDHRQQFVKKIDNVTFINDSKATNADATEKALKTFSNIYWIVGGRPKSDGLVGLDQHFYRVKKAYLIGESSDQFDAYLHGKVLTEKTGTLDNAVKLAWADAQNQPGDAHILLSPACASYDQFKDFEERGQRFIASVLRCARSKTMDDHLS